MGVGSSPLLHMKVRCFFPSLDTEQPLLPLYLLCGTKPVSAQEFGIFINSFSNWARPSLVCTLVRIGRDGVPTQSCMWQPWELLAHRPSGSSREKPASRPVPSLWPSYFQLDQQGCSLL